MGAAAAADERLIPPILGLDDPAFVCTHGQLDYAAEARLISDNLLDLSHISFLHKKSLQYSDTWARQRPRVTEHERYIQSERWFKDEGYLGEDVTAENRVDTFFGMDFFVPGVLQMTTLIFPVGTADAVNGERPDAGRQPVRKWDFTSQAITPLTDKTARYFYIFGNPLHPETGIAEAPEMSMIDDAFAEDKVMIEAQQRIIDLTPDWRFVSTMADQGAVLFQRMVERLAREERTGGQNLRRGAH